VEDALVIPGREDAEKDEAEERHSVDASYSPEPIRSLFDQVVGRCSGVDIEGIIRTFEDVHHFVISFLDWTMEKGRVSYKALYTRDMASKELSSHPTFSPNRTGKPTNAMAQSLEETQIEANCRTIVQHRMFGVA
jgi:hypothetical protein